MGSFPLRSAAAAACILSLASCAPAIVAGSAATLGVGVAQERSTADALTDIETQVAINNALLNESAALFSSVNIGVSEGRVLLTGAAPSPEASVRAVEIARAQAGTREVINEMSLRGRGYQGAARDAWIGAQVRGKLLSQAGRDSIDVNVEVYDGVVHLIGVARSRAVIERAARAAASVDGVSRVVSHMLTFDDPRRDRRA